VFQAIRPWLVYFEHAKTGTTVIHLGKGDIDQFECVLPPEDILIAFHDLIDPIFKKLLSNVIESRTLAKVRDILLPKLMSGELRVA
jgi:type I restriction enzyme S subunit